MPASYARLATVLSIRLTQQAQPSAARPSVAFLAAFELDFAGAFGAGL
jgi:hypothetical protein